MPRPVSADLRGGARLATDAVVGVTDIVEAVHAVLRHPHRQPERTRGVARWAYRAVRGVTRGVARALDRLLAGAAWAERAAGSDAAAEGANREALVAVVNGVLGDRLADQRNPLATEMQVRHAGRRLDLGAIARAVEALSDALVVRVHGLCMHDGQWPDAAPGQDALAEGLGATPIAVRYNTGRHISQNGRALAALLEALVEAWPLPVRRVVVVGHSMGGLVARSAFHYAAEAGHTWVGRDPALVTLGSPHHGAPLERIGNWVDGLLAATRFTAPLARIGQVRSAGVTDLRHGTLVDEDWDDAERFRRGPDPRRPRGLPHGVSTYVVAATLGDGEGGVRDEAIGDGLVPLDSALGRHADPARALHVPLRHQRVLPQTSHLGLLQHPEVTDQLLAWLAPPG